MPSNYDFIFIILQENDRYKGIWPFFHILLLFKDDYDRNMTLTHILAFFGAVGYNRENVAVQSSG